MHWLDPDYLPATEGKVVQFTLNPHGDLDGLVLDADRLVHFPPHMGPEVAKAIAIGDRVRVRGVRPRGAALIAAVALEGSGGDIIVDRGPPDGHKHDKPPKKDPKRDPAKGHHPLSASGEVRLSLFGPKGELRGALLADGTVLRVGPKEAGGAAKYLAPGAHISVRGRGIENKHGRVIEVAEIANGNGVFVPVKKPKKP
jgi:hypothetical protein